MQAIMETLFDIFYLTSVITLGILMASRKQAQKQYRLFGIMAILLGFGDAFHLIPRAFALWTTGLENHAFSLGIGKLITSITMTIFYVILYHVWRLRYHITEKKGLTAVIYLLAFLRIILCLCPQNAWTSPAAPLSWGIYRNIPFTIMGILIIILFYQSTRQHHDSSFKNMWLTILLSFGFYIPVVLFADSIPLMGMLMIPKTLAYLWTVWIGYRTMKADT